MQTLHGQGVGRFCLDEARGFREEIWTALNWLLEESRRKLTGRCFWCLGGEEPIDCDATGFGFVCSALVAER